jgi:hypothetical protein
MPARKDETVASDPFWVARVVPQMARPQGVRHGGSAHGEPGMTGIGLLNGIRGEEAEGVDRTGLEVGCHRNPDEWNMIDFTIGEVPSRKNSPSCRH